MGEIPKLKKVLNPDEIDHLCEFIKPADEALPEFPIDIRRRIVLRVEKISRWLLEQPKRFNTIIVDHTSGHAPGAFVERILSRAYGDHIPMHMHVLSRHARRTYPHVVDAAIDEKIILREYKPPVLVVTNTIDSGRSIAPLLRKLSDAKINHKVVAFDGPRKSSLPQELENLSRDRLLGSGNESDMYNYMHDAFGELKPVAAVEGRAYARPDHAKRAETSESYLRLMHLADALYEKIVK